MKWIIVIALIALIGPRLPALFHALGKGVRNFKRGLEGKEENDPQVIEPSKDDKR